MAKPPSPLPCHIKLSNKQGHWLGADWLLMTYRKLVIIPRIDFITGPGSNKKLRSTRTERRLQNLNDGEVQSNRRP